MRIFERLMYGLNISLTLWYALISFFQETNNNNFKNSVTYFLIFSIFATSIFGGWKEGIRTGQWICLALFIFLSVFIVFDYFSIIAFFIILLGNLAIITNNLVYGEGNLDKIKMVGPYQVGHQDFHLKNSGICGSCYYPMDKEEYDKLINLPGRNTNWLRYEESLYGIAKASADIGK